MRAHARDRCRAIVSVATATATRSKKDRGEIHEVSDNEHVAVGGDPDRGRGVVGQVRLEGELGDAQQHADDRGHGANPKESGMR